MSTIKTNYGILQGVTEFETFCRGKIESCTFEEANKITTPYGVLIPQYSEKPTEQRHKNYKSALTFYDNSQVKSLGLQEPTMIKTSVGQVKAEYVTFYKEGTLKEVYPLYGKMNKEWTEADEKNIAEEVTLDLDFGKLQAKIYALIFYPGGDLKNLILWPEDQLLIQGPKEEIEIRHGFTLYENGRIRSLEPNEPTVISTPVGQVIAYDPEAIGGHGQEYSLVYGKKGELVSLTTCHSGIEVTNQDGEVLKIEPQQEVEALEGNKSTLTLQFDDTRVIIEESNEHDQYVFEINECQFSSFLIK